MSKQPAWMALLEEPKEIDLPWTGDRSLHSASRTWTLAQRPPTHGWYRFTTTNRKATVIGETEPRPEILRHIVTGYLVGDRLVSDEVRVAPDPNQIWGVAERVHLLDHGLDRFVRVSAGRIYKEGPLLFRRQEFPLGPEEEVLSSFLDRKDHVNRIPGVVPALDASFRLETKHRTDTEQRRAELELLRQEEILRREAEERRQVLISQLGDGAGRRAMARVDFGEAARAALRIGGAELLDHRPHHVRGEWVVRFQLIGRRFECVCDDQLRIVDSGICLTAHDGTKGDRWLTLESLPGVIVVADETDQLVVYRHV